MAGDWEDLTLGDLGRVVTGKTPLTAVEGNFGGQIPFVTPSDMDGRKAISTTARNLTEAGAASIKGAKIPAGSVMVSCIGSDMGKAVIAGRDCVTNQQINSIVVDDRFSNEFVYYNLSTRKDEIRHQAAGGSAQPILNKGDFSRLEITLPPLTEQKAIAHILGTLDDKIELNRRMNATLEAMARALFQSWFVDFAPVRAKLDGRKPAGLDAATAALFPTHFQESPLGHIPQGWTAGTVREGFNLTMGQSPPGETYNEDGNGIPFYQGRTDFGFRFPTRRIYCTAPTRYAKSGDTLVSVRAPVGDINMADEECCIGRGVAAVRHKSGAVSFTYHAMENLSPDFALFEGEGTVFGSINKQNFENLRFVIPPPEIVAAYEHLAKPLDEQIRTLEHQSRTLATLRDTLLPQLLSGTLQINNQIGLRHD
ncbi:MAG: restriction endonuclease subunit S [Sulfuricellaceae bacterium]|nr:restriction endonuclease subunit S [Sulfuricellaceae bacterium]